MAPAPRVSIFERVLFATGSSTCSCLIWSSSSSVHCVLCSIFCAVYSFSHRHLVLLHHHQRLPEYVKRAWSLKKSLHNTRCKPKSCPVLLNVLYSSSTVSLKHFYVWERLRLGFSKGTCLELFFFGFIVRHSNSPVEEKQTNKKTHS